MAERPSRVRTARRRWTARAEARACRRDWRASGHSIATTSFVDPHSRLVARTHVDEYARINGPCLVTGSGSFQVGRYAAIGHHLTVVTSGHSVNYPSLQFAHFRDLRIPAPVTHSRPTQVGPATWLGHNVTILPGVVLGAGAVVGAGSIVTRDLAPFTVAVGAPARTMRDRFPDEVRALLMEMAWWDWTREQIIRNPAFFALDLTRSSVEQIVASVDLDQRG